MRSTCPSDAHAPDGLAALLERLPDEQLHHEERRAVLGDVDVADLDGAGVAEAVDREGLALEPPADLRDARGLGVQDLERVVPPDLVHADVDGGHPADAEQPYERPLVADDGPDAALGALVLRHGAPSF
jgi:hypothetical protein